MRILVIGRGGREHAIARKLAEVAREHNRKLLGATVGVGPMSTVVPELLNEAWKQVIKGTELADAELHIEHVPIQARCRECDAVTAGHDPFVKCRVCGSMNLKIESGFELQIIRATLSDDTDSPAP